MVNHSTLTGKDCKKDTECGEIAGEICDEGRREIPFLIFNSLFASIRPPTGTLHVKEFEPMTVTVTVVTSPMSHSVSQRSKLSIFKFWWK